MKTILLVVATVLCASIAQEEVKKVEATFRGFDDGSYFFETEKNVSMEFQNIEDKVWDKFDLTDKEFVGKKFVVSYTETSDFDEDEEEYTLLTIVDLQLK